VASVALVGDDRGLVLVDRSRNFAPRPHHHRLHHYAEEARPGCRRACTREDRAHHRCARGFVFPSRGRHARLVSDWSSAVCSSDLPEAAVRQLTDRLAAVLRGLIVEAQDRHVLRLAQATGSLWRAETGEADEGAAPTAWLQR